MASVRGWRPSAGAACWRLGASGAVSGFPPEQSVTSDVVRLKHRSEFVRVARDGRAWTSPGLVLQVWRRDDRDRTPSPCLTRDGFTTSRKVGNAVARNRARRRLREAARLMLPQLAAVGRDYVLIGRRATLLRPFPMLLADLRTALRRLRAERPAARTPGEGPLPEGTS